MELLSLRSAELLNGRRKLFGVIRQRRVFAAHMHSVACVPCACICEMSVCSKQSLIYCSPIRSIRKSGNPCHLHVRAHDVCLRVLSAACVLSLVRFF